MPAGKILIETLQSLLDKCADDLAQVTRKKMFGCHALFANEKVFAMVWKQGNIAVKLPDEAQYKKLMATQGAKPWKAGPRQMAHWVLLPENLQTPRSLKPWLRRAYDQALRRD